MLSGIISPIGISVHNMIWAGVLVTFSAGAAVPQEVPAPPKAPEFRQMSKEEIDVLYTKARKLEDAENDRRSKMMAHWTSAVCIGCGPVPASFRAVRTNPLRVLAGVPAWIDDERVGRSPVTVRLGRRTT